MWKDAYLESRVLSADPVELIHILYQHTLGLVQDARRSLAAGDIAARGNSISRAIAAIEELDGSLDHKSGGAISKNLAELYHYMRTKLLEANIKQKDAPLAEVESLLKTLGEAWNGISNKAQPTAPVETVPVPAWNGRFATIPEVDSSANAWSA
jgi:flagellar secretion chaperone FliS